MRLEMDLKLLNRTDCYNEYEVSRKGLFIGILKLNKTEGIKTKITME